MGLDGKILRPMDHDAAKSRRKMSVNGAAVITLVMDARGKVVHVPQISFMGLADEGQDVTLQDAVGAAVQDAIEAMPKSARLDDAAVRHTVGQAARRLLQESYGKKPVMDVHLVRV